MVGRGKISISITLVLILKMIKLLKSKHYSVSELADRFEVSERTVYRYLKTIEEVETIEKDFHNRFFITKD